MTKKFRVWCDSGANHASCYEQIIDLEDFDMSDAEWDSLTEKMQDEVMKEVAFERLDWGYAEIEGDEDE
jgi:hypothetical protein